MITTTLPSTLWPHLSRYALKKKTLSQAKGTLLIWCCLLCDIHIVLRSMHVCFCCSPLKPNKNLDMSINASNNFNLNITWSVGSTGNFICICNCLTKSERFGLFDVHGHMKKPTRLFLGVQTLNILGMTGAFENTAVKPSRAHTFTPLVTQIPALLCTHSLIP